MGFPWGVIPPVIIKKSTIFTSRHRLRPNFLHTSHTFSLHYTNALWCHRLELHSFYPQIVQAEKIWHFPRPSWSTRHLIDSMIGCWLDIFSLRIFVPWKTVLYLKCNSIIPTVSYRNSLAPLGSFTFNIMSETTFASLFSHMIVEL